MQSLRAFRTDLERGRLNWSIDSRKARRELGFAPRPLEHTLADTISWVHGQQGDPGLAPAEASLSPGLAGRTRKEPRHERTEPATTVPELLDWAALHHPDARRLSPRRGEPAAAHDLRGAGPAVRQRTEELPPGDGPVTVFLDSSVEWSINFLAIAAQARPAVLIDAKLEIAAVATSCATPGRKW